MGSVTHPPVAGPNDPTKQVSKTVYEAAHVVSLTLTDVGFPAGAMVAYGGAAAPSGWLLCDGSSYLRSDYPALFTAIGVAYGSIDATHFSVPDCRDRVIKGKGAATNLGDVAGSATHGHSDNVTHAGAAVANHVVTQPAAHTNHTVTQPNAHTFTQPAAHSNHVFTQSAAHADNIAHVHTLNVQGGTTAATTGTHVMTSTATGGSVRAVTTGDAVASQGTGATLTHSGGAVDAHTAHSGGAVDAHAGAAVDAHSAHSGTAVDAHAVTQPSAHAAHAAVNSEPPSQIANYIIKT